MKPRITLLRRTGRAASALAIPDSVALKLPLQACPKFENQVLTLRETLGQCRNYAADEAIPERISE